VGCHTGRQGHAAATQSITAGSMSVAVSSPTGTQSADHRTVTLADVGPTGSTFAAISHVDITNTGNIPATEVQLSASAVTGGGAAGVALKGEMYVKIISSGQTFYNGTLSGLIAGGPYSLGNGSLPDNFDVTFYAGGPAQADGTDGHGSAASAFTPASLLNDAEGGSVIPSISIVVNG
jgi:hypothetical protein